MNKCFAVDRDTREGDAKRTEAAGPVYRRRSQLYAENKEHGK